jgi:Ca2+-binding RTX toxin-like protein
MTHLYGRIGGEILANTSTQGSQFKPAITWLASGGFLVTWSDTSGQGGDSSSSGIKGQIFDASGNRVGGEFLVNSVTTGQQGTSAVAALASGGFVVSWVDDSGQGGDANLSGIKAQIFNASGNKVGTEFLVNTVTDSAQQWPAVTSLASGGFVVTWQSLGDIKAQIYGATGDKIGGEFLINSATSGTQLNAAVTSLDSGGFVVTWSDDSGQGGDASGSGIKAQIFNDQGGKVGSEFLVNTVTLDNQYEPTIAKLASGGFVVSWSDVSGRGGSGSDIKAQIFDAAGNKVGTEFVVNTTTASDQMQPEVASLPTGGFVITWTDTSGQGGDASMGLKAQVFDAAGGKVGTEFLVNTATLNMQYEPAIASHPSGRFAVTWFDEGGDPSGFAIKLQIFAPSDETFRGTDGDDIIFGTEAQDVINALGGNDQVVGRGGNDILDGAEGNDELRGFEGDDTLRGGIGADKLYGQSGADSIQGGDGADTIEGDGFSSFAGDGDDHLDGGAGDDNIRGGGGNDTILGGADSDILLGGAGSDLVEGGDGDDFLAGFGEQSHGVDSDVDSLFGGNGNDQISLGYGDSADGGSGADTLFLSFYSGATAGVTADFRQLADNGTMVVAGGTLSNIEYVGLLSMTQFDDVVIAGRIRPGVDGIEISGWGGNDDLTGTAGVDSIYGGDGDDVIRGGGGTNPAQSPAGDRLSGEAGNDTIFIGADGATAFGGSGDDSIFGGAGGDQLFGEEGADQLHGNGGNDRIIGWDGDDTLTGGSGDDVLLGDRDNDSLDGGEGNDSLSGGEGDDSLVGGDGNDTLDAGTGHDTLAGGTGNDVYVVDGLGDVVLENPGEGDADEIRVSLGNYRIAANVEKLTYTGAASTSLRGRASNEIITSGTGADIIYLQDGGDDTASGGAGNDRFYLGSALNAADRLDGGSGMFDQVLLQGNYAGLVLGANTLVNIETLVLLSGDDTRFGDTAGNLYSYDITTADRNVAAGERLTVDFSTLRSGENVTFNGSAETDGRLILFGGHGNDVLTGGAGGDALIGGGGADTLTGGAGGDQFAGTRAELAGDRITDFGRDDRIVVDDASLEGFEFSLNGETLRLGSGETVTLSGFTGRLVASAAAEGGVALTVAAPGAKLSNDFNGDGRSDVFWRETGGGAFSNWLGRPDGGLVNNDSAAYKVGVPVEWRVAGSGDFNGDGRSDILWRNDDGRITNWLGRADGSIGNNDANALSTVATSWRVVGTGDFNGDGRFDILWRNEDGRLTNWLGRADGGFANNDGTAMSTVATSWRVAGTGDFNGDGRFDILWRNEDGRLTNWLGRADGGFTNNDGTAMSTVPTSWQVVGTGDFNGDGRDDLLWRNADGRLSSWLGRADGGFTNNDAVALSTVATSWHVADTGDYNGDGRSDILWRNDNGGLTTWLGRADGGFINNDVNAFATVPTNWQVQNDYLIV